MYIRSGRGVARAAGVVVGALVLSTGARAQAIGPDCINSSLNDIARHGTNAAGTIVGYSSGNVTCNHGDLPMAASPNASIRPLVGMNMYRFKNYGSFSRFEQLGQGWAKWVAVPINGNNASCGSCSGGGSGTMGVNCADLYSSGFNSPGGMGPRSKINATTGYLLGARGGGTDETNINTRVQVAVADLAGQPAGTRYYFETIHLLPDDASYVRPGATVAINALNNATSHEINVNGGASAPSFIGAADQVPAIVLWAQADPSVTLVTADHDDTPNPNAAFPGTTIRSRFHVGAKVTDLGGGQWRYEYAVFNLNSDRSCGEISLGLPATASFTDFSFHHPVSHSGEPYSNAAWAANRVGNRVVFSTEKFANNQNANAIRWGTMYNFGFTTDVAPQSTSAMVLSLFKPGALASIAATGLPGPSNCVADFNADAGVTIDDLVDYLGAFEAGSAAADLDNNGDGAVAMPDGAVTIDDLLFYVVKFEGGC